MANRKRAVCFVIFVCTAITALYSFWIEPYTITVRHLYIENTHLHKVLRSKTVIQISDLHISSIGRREKYLLQVIEELQPDIMFLTGDYVPWNGPYEPALFFLTRLNAPIGVWAVMGDYDYSNSRKSCLFCHMPGTGRPTNINNIHFLKNSTDKISLPSGDFSIAGVDYERGTVFSADKVQQLLHDAPDILLSHSPMVFNVIDKRSEVLVLAGDTHGGQILLPHWLWEISGYEKCIHYLQGFFKDGQKQMYVSQGIGTSHVPLRLFRPPEVVVLHFL